MKGFRYRKSLRILPGLRLNLSKAGVSSVTIGVPGLSVNLGSSGAYLNTGLPGTGLAVRSRLGDTQTPAPLDGGTLHVSAPTEPGPLDTWPKLIALGPGLSLYPHTPNQHPDPCARCGGTVAAGEGRLIRYDAAFNVRWLVIHVGCLSSAAPPTPV
jgi:hypothetical protein